MNEKRAKNISKFLSLILRHSPQTIQLQLDENGWAAVEELITKCATNGNAFTLPELEEVVASNDKQRFSFNETHTHIRASQGHSIAVELDLAPCEPPEFLYHGTVAKFLDAIRSQGLHKMKRQHVHLSKDSDTAEKVASRRGSPVILRISSSLMHKNGIAFYLSENGVWLTDHVPVMYIEF
jgi:putative RNA 2'-phosphotransferase